MPFHDLPADETTDLASWDFRLQFMRAITERDWAVHTPSWWPPLPETYLDPYQVRLEIDGIGDIPPVNPAVGEKWGVNNGDAAAYQYASGEGNAPPAGTPSNYAYLVGPAPTGVWAGHPNCLAYWSSGKWRFVAPPSAGVIYWKLLPAGVWRTFKGGQWVDATGMVWFGQKGVLATWDGSSWSFSTPSLDGLTGVVKVGTTYATYDPSYAYNGTAWQLQSAFAVAGGYGLASIMPIYYIQYMLETLVPFFVPDDVAGFSGASAVPKPWTYTRWYAAIGLPPEARSDEQVSSFETSPPNNTTLGLTVAVVAPATGAFAGHEGQLATLTATSPTTVWAFRDVAVGYKVDFASGYASDRYYRNSYVKTAATTWTSNPAIGFTRKYPREITSLSAVGQAGQRARFIGTVSWANDQGTFSSNCTYGPVLAGPPTKKVPPPNTYVVGVQKDAVGDWAGHGGELAKWNGSAWSFLVPAEDSEFLFSSSFVAYPGGYWGWGQNPQTTVYVKRGDQWIPVDGSIYEHDGSTWARSDDQASGPDIVTTYGFAQAGDIVGPWLFNEVWEGIKRLHRRVGAAKWGGTVLGYGQGSDPYGHFTSYGPAVASCEGAALTSSSATWDFSSNSGPSVSTSGSINSYTGPHYSAGRSRQTMQQRGFFTSHPYQAIRKVDVDFYLVASQGASTNYAYRTFDAAGDSVANGAAVKWRSLTATDVAAYYTSPAFPSSGSYPSWPPDPTGLPEFYYYSKSSSAGYQVNTAFVIEDSAVSGGFEYQ